jgi:hypothetical protein
MAHNNINKKNIIINDPSGNPIDPRTILEDSRVAYQAALTIIPTTLTTGLNYAVVRNTSATKKVKITKIELIGFFVGTAAASRSLYNITLFTGGTATTGTAVPISKRNSINPTTSLECKILATGLAVTGTTFTGNITTIGHANQLSANIVHDFDYSNIPLVLNQNEGFVVQSNGAIVAGSTLLVGVQYYEI